MLSTWEHTCAAVMKRVWQNLSHCLMAPLPPLLNRMLFFHQRVMPTDGTVTKLKRKNPSPPFDITDREHLGFLNP